MTESETFEFSDLINELKGIFENVVADSKFHRFKTFNEQFG